MGVFVVGGSNFDLIIVQREPGQSITIMGQNAGFGLGWRRGIDSRYNYGNWHKWEM